MALAIESPQRHKRGKSRYLPLEAFVLLACFTIASILFIMLTDADRGSTGVLLRNQISVSLLIDSDGNNDSEIASESTETFGTKSSDVRHVADLSEEFVDDISVPFYIYPGMEAISYHIVQVHNPYRNSVLYWTHGPIQNGCLTDYISLLVCVEY